MTTYNPNVSAEWLCARDDLGIVYRLGRNVGGAHHEVSAVYYETDIDHATKQTLDADAHYRRCIYEGLPHERESLSRVERPEVVERLLAYTAHTGVGFVLDCASLTFSSARYKELKTWLDSQHSNARHFRQALHIACEALAEVDVAVDELSLYGGASFGMVNTTDKVVDDIDFVGKPDSLPQLRHATKVLGSSYRWGEIDPIGRLSRERQHLKAKRWSTSQIRLATPYPLTIDLKVARLPGRASLWDAMPDDPEPQPFVGDVKVMDDSEGLCISPAFRCADAAGNERIVLMDGYQYIGCAIVGDEIGLRGSAYRNSNVIHITSSAADGVTPDFRGVPIG